MSLLDEPVRLALVAAAEALAAAPGALYPLVYVGPLAHADALNRAAAEAAATFGIGFGEWQRDSLPRSPGLIVCGWREIADAQAALPASVQLVAWGSVPATELPAAVRESVRAPGNLVIDVEQAGLGRKSAWVGGSLYAAVTERSGPLVVIAAGDSLRTHADHALLLVEAVGATSASITLPETGPAAAEAVVAVWTASACAPEDVVRIAGEFRSARRALVLVMDETSWDVLRANAAWGAGGAPAAVIRVGPLVGDAAFAGVEWPHVGSVWIGAPCAGEGEAIMLPDGTALLEGLGYLEVRGRPGRLVAWRSDAVATVGVDVRAAGAVVVSAETLGGGVAGDREAVLELLDEVRRWCGLRLAIVWGGRPAGSTGVEEPVQRVGFHFSRLDDERRGAPTPPGACPAAGLNDVARALIGLGLRDAALFMLRQAERESRWGVEEEMLLGFLVAGADPQEAITRLRHAALRLATGPGGPEAWAQQTEATLNALLLLVRTRQASAAEAWATVSSWMEEAGTSWIATARHAAVLFELAARAGEIGEARRFAGLFRSHADGDEALRSELEPVVDTVVGCAT